jgi:hypothetical protein
MGRGWHLRIRLLATIALVWTCSTPLEAWAQTSFRVEVQGTHLPTFGNAYERLAEGAPGELSVVALAQPDGLSNTIAFVVRNATAEVVVPWVTATAQGSDGTEVLQGEATNPNAFPFVVEPGNLAIGEIAFEAPVPAGATLDVTVTGEPPEPGFILQEDIGPLWLDAFDPATGTGVVANQVARESAFLDNFWRRMACFADGQLQRLVVIDIDARSLAAGETSAFRLMQVEPGACEEFIFAGFGAMCEIVRGNVQLCGPERR